MEDGTASGTSPDLESSLSPNVYHLVCEVGSQITTTYSYPVLTHEGLIEWESLHQLLFGCYKGSWQIEKDFEQHVTKIAPFAKVVHDKVMNENRGVVKARWKHLFQWTTDSETMMQCLEFLLCSDRMEPCQSTVDTCLLLTTAILERSLGNVFLMKNSCCPSMLKDLLVTEELENIFGKTALFCLRILMGPPTSLNLRNLLWHGFVKPGEITERYAMFLLVLVGSLGQVLIDKDLDTRLNIVRPFADVSPQVSTLDAKFPDLNLLSEDVSCLFNELPIILQGSKSTWFKALENFQEERYSWSAALIIQLLESILRQVFAKSNGCPERVLTAESSTLFTTFDEILTGTLPDGSENKVRHVIGDGILVGEGLTSAKVKMEMLLDLLVYPNGPRFRDRLSHGELDFHSINPILVLILIHIIITLSDKLSDQEKFKKNVFYSKSGRLLCSYKSLFHPIPMLRDDYIRLCTTLDSWVGLPGPTNDELLANGLSNDTSGQFYDEVKNIFADKPMDSLAGEIIRFLEPFSDTHSHLNSCKKLKIETIFRARSELQLVTVLHQIVSQCAKVNENIQAISRRRFDQWEERQLRSRQRVNYLRFIVSIPQLSIGVRIVVLITFVYLRKVNHWEQYTCTAAHYKFLKKVLQFSENLFTLTEKNKWDESCVLVTKFLSLVKQFLDNLQEVTDT